MLVGKNETTLETSLISKRIITAERTSELASGRDSRSRA